MTPAEKTTKFERHLTEIAAIAKRIGEKLDLKADAQQACFATILISADKHGVFFDVANPEMTETNHDRQAAAKADAQIQDAPRQPTPEQAEAGAMTALKDGVKKACRLLNAEGYTPPLRPATLDDYIKKETDLGKPFAEFDGDDMEALIKNLSFKLTELQEKKKSNESKAGF
jgi:hypothetical protein